MFGKAKKWFNQGRGGRPHATVADLNALKEQFKQQFNPVGNTMEEQMASWRNIKGDGNETLDEFSYRVSQLVLCMQAVLMCLNYLNYLGDKCLSHVNP